MRTVLMCAAMVMLTSRLSLGIVQEYTDKQQWIADAGAYTTIHFTELGGPALVTDQYAYLGALFTDGSDFIHFNNSYLNDGVGLNAALDEITVEFTQPMTVIAADFPGIVQFTLFQNGVPFYFSSHFGLAGPSEGAFGGIISTTPFDEVLIEDPTGGTFIDDLYFGPPIPAPGVLPTLCIVGIAPLRRRRR